MTVEELQTMIHDIDQQLADAASERETAQQELDQLTDDFGEALADGEASRAKTLEARIAKLRAAIDALPTKVRALTRRREKAVADLAAVQLVADRAELATLEEQGLELWRQLDADLAKSLATFEALRRVEARSAYLEGRHRTELARFWSSAGQPEFVPPMAAYAKALRAKLERLAG